MSLLLYIVVTAVTLPAWSRWVTPLTRAAAVTIVFLPLLFTGPALVSNRAYGGFDDPGNPVFHEHALQQAPWKHQVRRAFANGEWPLWNSSVLSGQPLAGAMQGAPYDPVNLMALLLPEDIATAFAASMTLFLAALFTFALARDMERSAPAALIAAAIFTCSSAMVFWVGWPLGRAWAMLPFVLLATRRVAHARDGRAFVLLTLSLVLLILCGHPETVLHVTTIGVIWGSFELYPFRNRSWKAAAIAVAAGVLALLLTAFFLLPFAAIAGHSAEYRLRQDFSPAPWSSVARSARATLLPAEWDFGFARAGLVALVLAVIAVIRDRRRPDVRFLALLAAIALLAAWRIPLVMGALHQLPLFDVALNERLGIVAVLAIALLASAAFHSPSRVAFGILLAVIVTQRIVENGNVYPAVPRNQFFPTIPLIEKVPRDPLYRFTAAGDLVIPNVGAMDGLEDVRGYEAMTYRPYVQTKPLWCPDANTAYFDVHDLTRPFLSFLGVRYALTPRSSDVPPGWRVLAEDGDARLIENPNAVPRVFTPRFIRYVRDEEQPLREMSAAADFRHTAWVLKPGARTDREANGEAALAVRRSGSRYDIDVDARGPTRVVITEASWPGWRAELDGRRVAIEQSNRAFLSVAVPRGNHRLTVRYLPDAFVTGGVISLCALVIAGVAIAIRSG